MELLPLSLVASFLLRVARSGLEPSGTGICHVCSFFRHVHPIQSATPAERTLTCGSGSASPSDALIKSRKVSDEASKEEDAYQEIRRHVGAASSIILLAIAIAVCLVLY